MKWFTNTLIIVHVVLMDCTDGQYPDCVACTDGSIPLSPLSYNTMRSNVFNGTQPSNEGCTNGVSIDGQVTIDCGQGTTLIDCDQGFDGGDYSDLSRTFAWNRTTSVAQQVSIVFRFDQQINISRISMFFWNSPSNSIIVPNVRLAWADHNMQFTDETAITTNLSNRTGDGQSILNVGISNDMPKFVYLRIIMTFNGNSDWIFLGEVKFCGNTAPYHITQPSTDNDVQIVSPNATMTSITCSLNITIPSTVTTLWLHNNSNLGLRRPNDNTTTLVIENLQPSDAGVYQCVFNDLGSKWTIRRNVRLIIADITTTTASAMPTTSTATSTAIASTSTTTTTTSTTTTTASVTTNIPSVTSTPTPSTTIITTSATDSSTVSSTDTSTATIDTYTSIASLSTSSASSSVTSIAATTTTTTPAVASTAADTTTTTVISSTTHITTTTVVTTAAFVSTTAITTVIASTAAPDDNTSAAFTAGITTTPAITTSSSSNSSNAADTSDSSDSNTIVIAVVVVIVVILLIAIIVTTAIMIYYWRKKKSSYHVYGNGTEPNEEPPLTPPYATVDIEERKSSHYVTSTVHNSEYGNHTVAYNQNPPLKYAVPNKKEKKEKRKSADPQRRMSIEFNYRPDRSPDISIRSPEPTLSVINPDYEETTFDIFSSVPDIPERTEASHGMVFDDKEEENPIYNRSENPIYSEAINPAAIVTDLSADYCTVDDKVSPYASIYTDPLPLVKSEGPPIVSNKNIQPLHKLGVGLFGEVVLANTVGLSYRDLGIGNSNNTNVSIKVAVKMLKASPSEEVRKSFEKEIKFMSRLKDDNVIRLLGICTTGTPFIMMEYMENGDLNNYLQKFKFTHETGRLPAKNEINLIALVYMSFQIASGMKYLSSRNFIHRDLAARNVLVGVDYTVKIADFGMSQNLYSEYYCRVGGQKVLPIRWMACECFFGKFSVKTDVWAFGITLWEIFTLCRCLPYDDLTNHQLIEDAVKGADRSILERPKICPDEIYRIMRSCWHHESSERATFAVLCDQLNQYYYSLA